MIVHGATGKDFNLKLTEEGLLVIASSTPAVGRPALDETSPYRPSPYRHGRACPGHP
jgi:hypothetical protein